MLENYLNQTALKQAQTGKDTRGQLTHATSATSVKCRKEQRTQTVMSADGRLVTTSLVYFMQNAVQEGDLLDGKLVMAVEQWADLSGAILGYKAVV